MLHWLRARLAKEEAGFTLIELMVVVLIIAILIAIAIPTFLGLRTSAQDRAAQSDLRNGLTAAKTYYADEETYAVADTDLEAIETSLEFDDLIGSATADVIGFTGADTSIVMVKGSASGTYFCIADNVNPNDTVNEPGTTFNSGVETAVDTLAECQGASW